MLNMLNMTACDLAALFDWQWGTIYLYCVIKCYYFIRQ